jgi:ATP phosphoribosyltransferase
MNGTNNTPVTLALAKGRISEEFFAKYSSKVKAVNIESRKLIYQIDHIKVILVKPVDVPTYVAAGVADLGIVGRDVVLESGKSFYELNELDFSKCRMSIAGFDENINLKGNITIATKYPNICHMFFPNARTIYLNGSVELAPIMELSDVIFDIVETGATLRENGLVVIKDVIDINPVLIANKASYKFNRATINEISALFNPEEIEVLSCTK